MKLALILESFPLSNPFIFCRFHFWARSTAFSGGFVSSYDRYQGPDTPFASSGVNLIRAGEPERLHNFPDRSIFCSMKP